jgi:hypothetical protein
MVGQGISIEGLAKQAAALADERVRAVWIHDWVRDRVAFGFTPWFDEAPPDATLARGRGHCNPQAALFVAACRAAGLEARFHAVTISHEILDGIFPHGGPPPLLTHVFSEVRLAGQWRRTDSYIIDPALREAALARLAQTGRRMGYGVHGAGTGHWDGRSDAFSQFVDPAMAVADLGTFDSLTDVFRHPGYCHRYAGLRAATWLLPLRLLPGRFEARANQVLEAMRREVGPAVRETAAASL